MSSKVVVVLLLLAVGITVEFGQIMALFTCYALFMSYNLSNSQKNQKVLVI